MQDSKILKKKIATLKNSIFKKEIGLLPSSQQESITACLSANQKKKKGIRYTRDWIYECILLKIRGNASYNYFRRHKLLQLPHPTTIYRYLRNMKSCFGFQPQIFNLIKEKVKFMAPKDKRGIFLMSYSV